jgi:hypothetical protein
MILTTPNSMADDFNTTPSPSIAAVERQNTPQIFPSADQITDRAPKAEPLRKVSKMDGPGEAIANAATAEKVSNVCVFIVLNGDWIETLSYHTAILRAFLQLQLAANIAWHSITNALLPFLLRLNACQR